MVNCAAVNCSARSDSTKGEKVHFHKFPKDPKLQKVWEIKLKRKGLVVTKDTRVCHQHFEPDCYVRDPRLMLSIGFQQKAWVLKPDAVPTIFNFEDKTTENSDFPNKKRRRNSTAFAKRRKLEVLEEILPSFRLELPSCDPVTTNMCGFTEEPYIIDDLQTESLPHTVDKCVGTENEMFSVGTQTTYSLVNRRHVQCTTDIHVPSHSRSIQCEPDTCEVSVQVKRYNTTKLQETGNIHYDMHENVDNDNESNDPDWFPDVENESDEECDTNYHLDDSQYDLHKQRKVIVFQHCLKTLLDLCPACYECGMDHKTKTTGTMLTVISKCSCGYSRLWNSQPLLSAMPAGNLLLSAGIMFSGSSPVKAINALTHSGIATLSLRTYNLLQSVYLVPSVISVWNYHQSCLIENYKANGHVLKLGGDARCCSPGHTAKYGSYSLMDVQTSKVVDVQLIQCNEVANSQAMELEGLKRGLNLITECGVAISDLITDRHVQVKKYIREKQPGINHWFDVWHVAKGVYKKLEQKAKKKKFETIGLWSRSISNHMYWCAASSGGDGEMLTQKWTSVLNHVVNIHTGHGDKFPNCQHEPLEDRAWIKKDSAVHREMESVVCSKHLLKDIKKLSPAEQTSTLESFHKVVCQFAPKSGHFFYETMKARLYLAALHFNSNSNRAQATTKTGEPCYSVSFPKGRKGDPVIKPVKVKQNFDYIHELMEEVSIRRGLYSSYRLARAAKDSQMSAKPNSLSSRHGPVNKQQLVELHVRRFNTT